MCVHTRIGFKLHLHVGMLGNHAIWWRAVDVIDHEIVVTGRVIAVTAANDAWRATMTVIALRAAADDEEDDEDEHRHDDSDAQTHADDSSRSQHKH